MDKILKAQEFAKKAHAEQVRKGTNIPYITHPMEVCEILKKMDADEDVLCAGLLHDTVEDAGVLLKTLEQEFGKKVADLVGSHSEDKSLSWKERKTIALTELAHAPKNLQMMVLADKLSNARATRKDYMEMGDKVWERFNAGKKDQEWYYREGLKALESLKDDNAISWAYNEFKECIQVLFGNHGK